MRLLRGILSGIVIFLWAPVCGAACVKTDSLFVIERSKNKNTVHYDACVDGNDDLSVTDPVIAYWVLEDGTRRELSALDRRYAYGVVLREKPSNNSVRITLVSMTGREICVGKNGGRYVASMEIDGRESILEWVYVNSRDSFLGWPRVISVDFRGITKYGHSPVKERIENP